VLKVEFAAKDRKDNVKFAKLCCEQIHLLIEKDINTELAFPEGYDFNFR
jgi:hypothetical protein